MRRSTGPDELLVAGAAPAARAPDHALESRALLSLAAAVARAPASLYRCLVEAALAAAGGEAAGLLSRDSGSARLTPLAVIGSVAGSGGLPEA